MLSRQHMMKGLAEMAFLAANFGVIVSYTDAGANQVTREYLMDNSIISFDDALTEAGALLVDIIAATDASLPQYRVFRLYQDTAFALPASTVQIENTASMTLLVAGLGSKKANINLPAPKIGVFVSPSGPQQNIVNTTAAIVTNFVDNFLVAGKFTISDGEKASRILNGKRVHKRSSKG